MLIRRTQRSSPRRRLRNARFKSNVFFVSPSRPATKLRPGRSRGMPFSPRSRPRAFTIRIAARHPSASMFRLFASVTRGSADSSPNERLVPGVAKATRSRMAAMASSGCATIIAGSPLSVCKTLRFGAAARIPSSSSRIAGPLTCGVAEGPAVPLLHRPIAVRPLSGRQAIVDRRVEVPQRDPVERLDERLVVIAETGQRASKHSRTLERARMMDDFSVADRQASEILARHDRARDEDEEVALRRMTIADLVDRDVFPRVARIADRARHVSRVRRDVRRHAEVRWLVDVAIEDHDLHEPESMPTSR